MPHKEAGPAELQKVQTQKLPRSASRAAWLHTGPCRSSGTREGLRVETGAEKPKKGGPGPWAIRVRADFREQIQSPLSTHFLTVETETQRRRKEETEPIFTECSPRPRQRARLFHISCNSICDPLPRRLGSSPKSGSSRPSRKPAHKQVFRNVC